MLTVTVLEEQRNNKLEREFLAVQKIRQNEMEWMGDLESSKSLEEIDAMIQEANFKNYTWLAIGGHLLQSKIDDLKKRGFKLFSVQDNTGDMRYGTCIIWGDDLDILKIWHKAEEV